MDRLALDVYELLWLQLFEGSPIAEAAFCARLGCTPRTWWRWRRRARAAGVPYEPARRGIRLRVPETVGWLRRRGIDVPWVR